MRAPAFWWKEAPDPTARLLRPFAAIWNSCASARMARPGQRAKVPVICVGNFVAGGAGKTPTAIALARILQSAGEAPVFLTRGYGGANSTREPLRVDPSRHIARQTGDEALLLAAIAPTIVCVDRVRGADAAMQAGASVIIMDDGLQNPSLAKDVSIAVVDGGSGIGNGLVMPAGPLRASLATQLPFVSAILLIGGGEPGARVARIGADAGRKNLRGHLTPEPSAAASLKGQRVLAFAGIGRPEKYFETLRDIGVEIVSTRTFPDHHAFSAANMAALMHEARQSKAILVTTEKDRVRLPADFDVKTLPVTLVFEEAGVDAWLIGELAKVRAS